MHPSHVYVPLPDNPPDGPPQPRIRKIINKTAFVTRKVKSTSPLFSEVVPILQERGLIAENISSGIRRWQGVVRVPDKNEDGEWCTRDIQTSGIQNMTGKFRRLDLKYVAYPYYDLYLPFTYHSSLVPLKSKGAGLIAFTGDIQLNKDLRLRAAKIGLLLNEFGLWKWNPNDRPKDPAKPLEEIAPNDGYWQLIKAPTEQDIFNQLGMEYIKPHRRNFSFVYNPSKRSNVPQ